MEAIRNLTSNVAGFIWGGTWGDATVIPYNIGPLAVVLLGTGLFMMYRLGARPLRRFVPALVEVWQGRKAQGEAGAITPWQALSTALSGQVGTGNLAGVATAISLGGPGSIFWMWVVAIFGMALAFSESSLAIKYRETKPDGGINGGPMYYIKNGLGKGWGWLAIIFCIATMFSAFTTGSLIQANSIKEAALETGASTFSISIPPWTVGLLLSVLVFAVIIGGIKSIGSFAGRVVPVMAGLYVLIAFCVLVANAAEVPAAFMQIIRSAFGLQEAAGGAAGYGVMQAVRYGIARGLFSNEAGQGSAPIAHAAAQTKSPVMQGEIAMIGVFIDTIIICTMTALVILTVQGDFKKSPALEAAAMCTDAGFTVAEGTEVEDLFPSAYADGRDAIIAERGDEATTWLIACRASGVEVSDTAIAAASDPAVLADVAHAWETDASSAAITTRAYGAAFPGGQWIVPIALFFFAFTTIIGWSYYGEQAATFLVGERAVFPFRIVWVLIVFLGTVASAEFVWELGDIGNASMVFPNLVAIIALSGVVVAMHNDPEGGAGASGKRTRDAASDAAE